jgi:hypothetical protein
MFGSMENGTETMDIITTNKGIGPTTGPVITGTVVAGKTGPVATFGSKVAGINPVRTS